MKPHTSNRQAILDRLRAFPVAAEPLPVVDSGMLTEYDDPLVKFSELLGSVGGQLHEVGDSSEIEKILASLSAFKDAKQIASLVPSAVQGNVDLITVADPHDLAPLDWMIAPGEFMVAENGAIWVDGNRLPHRVLLFIAQYLAIVVPRGQIVSNMHQAYARIGNPAPGFGVFVSGPSKTADIEQSLVLGAHGCRTLHVFAIPDTKLETPKS